MASNDDWSTIRSIYQIPLEPNFPYGYTISLRHPSYPDIDNTLFEFNAFDHSNGGIDRIFALTACAVVAGNKWDGYLSQDKDGPPTEETTLTAKSYYFHPHPYHEAQLALTEQNPFPYCSCACYQQPYPIYPTFRDWCFPRENLPPWWPFIPRAKDVDPSTPSNISVGIIARDRSCRVTGSLLAKETAHIIPVKEDSWFRHQKMYDSSDDQKNIDSSGNLILLRKDLHFALDQLKWTIIPKSSQWVFYALNDSEELTSLYHKRALRSILGVKREYLLAGFARAIFPWLNNFLRNGINKYLIGIKLGIQDPAGMEMPGDWCVDSFLPLGYRSRSASPKKNASPGKRKRANLENEASSSDSYERSLTNERFQDEATSDLSISTQCQEEIGSDQPRLSKRRVGRNPLFAKPCQCAVLPPTPTVSVSARSDYNFPMIMATCFSDKCVNRKEEKRQERLRQEALKHERTKSEVADWWKAQTDWARTEKVRASGGDGQMERWLWAIGQEVIDDEGEYEDTKQDFMDMVNWT